LPDPGITARAQAGDDGTWTVTLRTERYARAVHLEGFAARTSDDYFDLLPGEERTVVLTPEDPATDVSALLEVRTLAGTVGPAAPERAVGDGRPGDGGPAGPR
ncbi:MAG: hypothetical protein PVI57_16500, partial [Gemmatimonadota bacterium]|jgi:hypothetical protein